MRRANIPRWASLAAGADALQGVFRFNVFVVLPKEAIVRSTTLNNDYILNIILRQSAVRIITSFIY